MTTHLEFLNKNWYRKYPLRMESTFTMPKSLFAGASITVLNTFPTLFISKIHCRDMRVNLVVSHLNNDLSVTDLGYTLDIMTNNNQAVQLKGFVPLISGHIILGDINAWKMFNDTVYLSPEEGLLESSCVKCFIPPAVEALVVNDQDVTGNVTLNLVNINQALYING